MSALGKSAPSEPPAPADDCEKPEVLPPDGAFVTLSEAMSWIAFRVSVGCDALSARLGEDTHSATNAHRRLRSALDAVLAQGRTGHIQFLGKYIASSRVPISAVQTDAIDPIRLIDFGRFNIHRDGLEWGNGLTWHHYDGQMRLARTQQARPDYFHSVKVARAELMVHFPPSPDPASSVELSAPPARKPIKKYKGGDDERDRIIIAKLDALKKLTGSDGHTVATLLTNEEGYGDVTAEHARALMRGRYKQGSGEPR